MGKVNVKFSKTSVKRTVKEYVIMTIGLLFYAFAWVGIILPANGVGGGASGIALLVYYATGGVGGGIPIGVSFLVVNAILVVAAVFTLGAKFGTKTIYSIFVMSAMLSFLQGVLPDNVLQLANDKLLSAILGGAMAGFGVSLCLMQGGSTGGTDIIAMIINKYRNISYGRVIMASDFIIISCSYFIFGDLATIVYALVLAAVFSYTADAMMAGNKQSSQLFVMSEKYGEIADMITHGMHRGATVIDGVGWYTKKPSKVVMVMCRKAETNLILQRIKEVDQKAFVTVGSIMGVYGQGFDTFRR